MSREHIFSSEAVSRGHPDKLADQISDAVVDDLIRLDRKARAAIETLIGSYIEVVGVESKRVDYIVISGEAQVRKAQRKKWQKILTEEKQIPALARRVLRTCGYSDGASGFDVAKCKIEVRINIQSRAISKLVDGGQGAGDQGMMYGYACKEVKASLMPAAIHFAQKLMRQQEKVVRGGKLPLLPDAKSMVWVKYQGDQFIGIDRVVVSTQHKAVVKKSQMDRRIRNPVYREIIDPVIPVKLRCEGFKWDVNPRGLFAEGGPSADTGLTGRKIVVDTYGGSAPNGGGAFSGKDPTKVDRSAAYAARWVAKHIVKAGLAERCTVQLAYVIGETEQTVYVDTHGTSDVGEDRIEDAVNAVFDLTPSGIIKVLKLHRPIYLDKARFGHFGRANLSWESIDSSKVKKLQNAVS